MNGKAIAVTAGDPAGIGYEIACKFFYENEDNGNIYFIAHKWIVEKTYKEIIKKDMPDIKILEPDTSFFDYNYGEHNARCGKAAMDYVEYAVKRAMDGDFAAIVTCPINKKSIKDAGYDFPGHTEYLSYLSNTPEVSMMLAGNTVRTILATTHYPLSQAASHIDEKTVLKAINNAHKAGGYFGKPKPKIAVCALNPHAGDGGALGHEETDIIMPAIKKAADTGINVHGPFPADSLFAQKDGWDFIVAMYHDQGMIPVKMDAFGEAVNVTLNLPFIRTSVDHGTAFDIAGKGKASCSSLRKAVLMAKEMAKYDKFTGSI